MPDTMDTEEYPNPYSYLFIHHMREWGRVGGVVKVLVDHEFRRLAGTTLNNQTYSMKYATHYTIEHMMDFTAVDFEEDMLFDD